MATDAGVRSIEDLENYGKALAQCSEALNETLTDIQKETKRVCDGWNDKKAQLFEEELYKKTTELQKLAEIMTSFSDYIKSQCIILKEYEHNQIK